MNIGIRIKELRKEQKITQDRLSEYLGISPQAVSKLENGTFSMVYFLIRPLTIDEILSSCVSSSNFKFSTRIFSFSGFLELMSKNSLGEIFRYSHIKKKHAIEGMALPDSILLIYPGF